MKVVITAERPCRMPKGTLRRVPQNRTQRLLGYSLCCPRCGFVSFVLQGDEGQTITEVESEAGVLISMAAPTRCLYCGVRSRMANNEVTFEEGTDGRSIGFQ